MLDRRMLLGAAIIGPALAICARAPTAPQQGPMAPLPHDERSHANPNEARVKHVALDLTADFNRKVFSGTATLDIATAPGAREIVLDVLGLTIRSVKSAAGAD